LKFNVLSKVVVFDTQEALIDAVEEVKVGTLAFVVSDQMLYIRSAPGWRSITVRHLKNNNKLKKINKKKKKKTRKKPYLCFFVLNILC